MTLTGFAEAQEWALESPFVIARSRRDDATVLYVELRDGDHVGRGEGQPNSRYGQCADRDQAALNDWFSGHEGLQQALVAGDYPQTLSTAGRNALEAAWLDIEAQRASKPVWQSLGLDAPEAIQSAITVSIDTPEAMADRATRLFAGGAQTLKLKLGSDGDQDRMHKVRRAVPDATLIADANEGWTVDTAPGLLDAAADAGIAMVEQPLAAGTDAWLEAYKSPVPLCADESFSAGCDLAALARRYAMVNIKLDKFGGLRNCVEIINNLSVYELPYMLGCMLGTSLAVAPAMLLAGRAHYVDLDGPLLLRSDRRPSLLTENPYELAGCKPGLWGVGRC